MPARQKKRSGKLRDYHPGDRNPFQLDDETARIMAKYLSLGEQSSTSAESLKLPANDNNADLSVSKLINHQGERGIRRKSGHCAARGKIPSVNLITWMRNAQELDSSPVLDKPDSLISSKKSDANTLHRKAALESTSGYGFLSDRSAVFRSDRTAVSGGSAAESTDIEINASTDRTTTESITVYSDRTDASMFTSHTDRTCATSTRNNINTSCTSRSDSTATGTSKTASTSTGCTENSTASTDRTISTSTVSTGRTTSAADADVASSTVSIKTPVKFIASDRVTPGALVGKNVMPARPSSSSSKKTTKNATGAKPRSSNATAPAAEADKKQDKHGASCKVRFTCASGPDISKSPRCLSAQAIPKSPRRKPNARSGAKSPLARSFSTPSVTCDEHTMRPLTTHPVESGGDAVAMTTKKHNKQSRAEVPETRVNMSNSGQSGTAMNKTECVVVDDYNASPHNETYAAFNSNVSSAQETTPTEFATFSKNVTMSGPKGQNETRLITQNYSCDGVKPDKASASNNEAGGGACAALKLAQSVKLRDDNIVLIDGSTTSETMTQDKDNLAKALQTTGDLERQRDALICKLDAERNKCHLFQRRFDELHLNHVALIKIKDEYKEENARLRNENFILQKENERLFSSQIQALQATVSELSDQLTEASSKYSNLESKHEELEQSQRDLNHVLQERQDELKRIQDRGTCNITFLTAKLQAGFDKEKLEIKTRHEEQQQEQTRVSTERITSLRRDNQQKQGEISLLKYKLQELEDERKKKFLAEETNVKLRKDKEELLELARHRGEIIQEKQSEAKHWCSIAEDMGLQLKQKELECKKLLSALTEDKKIKRLQISLDQTKVDKDKLGQEFEAYKQHMSKLLNDEQTLNKRLRHIIGPNASPL